MRNGLQAFAQRQNGLGESPFALGTPGCSALQCLCEMGDAVRRILAACLPGILQCRCLLPKTQRGEQPGLCRRIQTLDALLRCLRVRCGLGRFQRALVFARLSLQGLFGTAGLGLGASPKLRVGQPAQYFAAHGLALHGGQQGLHIGVGGDLQRLGHSGNGLGDGARALLGFWVQRTQRLLEFLVGTQPFQELTLLRICQRTRQVLAQCAIVGHCVGSRRATGA